jgi:uncharacterized protein (TIGR04255 family)
MTTYPTNFIRKVIARVDFQPILTLKQEEPVAFQELIRDHFPRFGRKNSIDISIKPGEVPISKQIPIWEFTNKEKTDQIALNFKFITLSLDKYVSFEAFNSKIEFLYINFKKIYHPGIIQKIGLRFINEIRLTGNPLDWDGIINNNLYCILQAFPEFSPSLSRAMSQLHINLGDRLITFQFGIYNSQYPGVIANKEFILDYDCSSKEECEPEEVLTKFSLFYEDIKNLFKQSRGDKLVAIMRGEGK